jgi:uncharacterized membrane protein YbhN (UPF0104 family)
MGELSLPLLLSRFVAKTRSFSALLITRIASAVAMLGLFAVSLLYVFHGFGQFDFSFQRLISGIGVLAALVAAFFLLSRIKLKSSRIVDYIREKLLKLKSSLLFSWKNELTILNVIFLILITLGYLTFMALFYQFILTRLQVSVSLMEIFYLMSLHMAILILPIRSFGGIGTTEGVWMAGMMTLGIGSSLALESGLIIHIIQLFSATVYFLIGLALKHFMDRKAG